MPATSGGMGSPGAMMAPMAAGAGRESNNSEERRETTDTLLLAAQFYRPPEDLPVVTGGAGAQFVTREEGRESL